jgi:hypothetical protein
MRPSFRASRSMMPKSVRRTEEQASGTTTRPKEPRRSRYRRLPLTFPPNIFKRLSEPESKTVIDKVHGQNGNGLRVQSPNITYVVMVPCQVPRCPLAKTVITRPHLRIAWKDQWRHSGEEIRVRGLTTRFWNQVARSKSHLIDRGCTW